MTSSTAPDPIPRSKFDRWLWARGISNADAAQHLGCSVETIRRYRLPFGDLLRRVPDAAMLQKIFEWTRGDVTPNDFHSLGAAGQRVAS